MAARQRRRDARIEVAYPVSCEKTLEVEQHLHPRVAEVYERIQADPSGVGERFRATVRDLSVNGAFLEGPPLPLLSRVVMQIEIPDFKVVDAVGWVLWRRTAPCRIEDRGMEPLDLGAGFGVIFEWIPLEARLEIARRVAKSDA